MSLFSYRAQTTAGLVVAGTLKASSHTLALETLANWGLTVLSSEEEGISRRSRLCDYLFGRSPGAITGPSAVQPPTFVLETVAVEEVANAEESPSAIPGPRSRPSGLAERLAIK